MTVIRRLTASLIAVVGTIVGLLIAATAAGASLPPADYGDAAYSVPQAPASTPTITITNTGSPWWTFVLVAAAAVAITLLVSLVVSRLRHQHTATQLAH